MKNETEVRSPRLLWGYPWDLGNPAVSRFLLFYLHILQVLLELQPSCLYIRQEKLEEHRDKRDPPSESAFLKVFLKSITQWLWLIFHWPELSRPPQTAVEAGKCSFVAGNVAVLNKIEVFLKRKREDRYERDNSHVFQSPNIYVGNHLLPLDFCCLILKI